MGGSSSSKTSRTYNTTNVSQQGEANVYGTGNTTIVQRADAITLDNLAKELGKTTRAQTGVAADLSQGAFDLAEELGETTRTINKDSLDFAKSINGDSVQLAREVAQAGEESTQKAMDFVSQYTERAQVGNAAEATKTVMWVAGVAGITLVGIAFASKGGFKA